MYKKTFHPNNVVCQIAVVSFLLAGIGLKDTRRDAVQNAKREH